MDHSPDKIDRARALLIGALALLDEREFLVEAAFVQTALDRIDETIRTRHAELGSACIDTVIPLRKP